MGVSSAGTTRANVEAVLLGMAQDGGLPQAGCDCPTCRAAWEDPCQVRQVACLGLIDRSARRSWMIDATPDFRDQWHSLQSMAPECSLAGIFLTHAHVGHYAGMIHLGREAANAAGLSVHASVRTASFLRCNGPWSQLVAQGNIRLQTVTPGQEVEISPALQLMPYSVPHRDELSDTLAYVVRGPSCRLFYCPDIDGWDLWPHDLRGFVADMDVALLDGTFFSPDELPGRDVRLIPHPLARDTAERLTGVDCDVRLIHLNHSNPLHHPGPERNWLAARGMGVGMTGDRWSL